MNEGNGPTSKRNFLLLLFEGALFIAGMSFISPQTVLPALVTRLGGGNVAVGGLSVILWFGQFLPQIAAARLAQSIAWKKPWAIGLGLLQRFTVLLTGITVLLLGGTSPGGALAAFLLLFLFMQLSLGFATPVWYDMFAKMTPLNRRGRLSGLRNSIGGAGGLVCSVLLGWLLVSFSFPANYALAFLGAILFQGVSIALQFGLVEVDPSRTVPRPPVPAFVRQIRTLLSTQKEFRTFLISCAFLILGGVPVGFFTVYALDRFGAPESVVGEFTLTLVAVQVVSALVNGYVADRFGNRIVLAIAAAAMLLASLWALLAPTLDSFRLVFVFVGINLGSELMARYNMSVEFGPAERHALYIGLMNTALAPLYLFGLAGGWLADLFGFPTLFVVCCCSAAVAALLLVFRVHDPRVPQRGEVTA